MLNLTEHQERKLMTLFFNEERVRASLTYDELIRAMEQALIDFSTGRATQPVRTIVSVPDHSGFFGVMPARYGNVMGAKLVTFYQDNAQRQLPTHLATIHLLSAATGESLAIMDGRLITEMRTAAVSAAATRLLANSCTRVVAILGSGVQARAHFQALRVIRDFEEVRVWSPKLDHARRFAAEIGATLARSPEEAAREADVVITATSAHEPVLRGAWLKEGAFVNAIGGIGPTRRELDDDCMKGLIVVESREAVVRESGDVILSRAPIYAELGELLAGMKPVPEGSNVVFKSVGIAIEDIAAAELVYRKNASPRCRDADSASQ